METGTAQKKITLGFINDKNPIADIVCDDLTNLGFEILYRSEHIEDGITQLSALKSLPQVCIIDLDFYDSNVLTELRKLRKKYPSVKLIAFSEKDSEQSVKTLLNIGFEGYLLIGSDTDDFKKAIDVVTNSGRYFSVGIAKIAQEYFTDN
ncbi:response regulator receiver protein [Pseudopedobacter saltans DSM 12145]|mgnify:CR=1 FL=1|uniref:Response regulator receiver protein n=1 Tax=Pseudopedobacter saltans (strain ATCC 51119 / DSM 12145 / JCM 21818 / CCUG 39354 / LMG 10337 / NBRC 100064 / NCIMB 13643) TaxID=762903 RepID=F0S601_PSESL|nr:response regulator transcription factor [Pseudopedobacter saltans]ADY52104.1 response regulator receiver protein [Pseudopedobacter saltans DSM 12145]